MAKFVPGFERAFEAVDQISIFASMVIMDSEFFWVAYLAGIAVVGVFEDLAEMDTLLIEGP